jgi:hypothetical protein
MPQDWSEFIPPGVEVPTDEVIELAGKWKHGYIPLDATALREKMKGQVSGKQWWSGPDANKVYRDTGPGGGRGLAKKARAARKPKPSSDPLAEMHKTMAKQKPESPAEIRRRGAIHKGNKGTPLMRNPSNDEYNQSVDPTGMHARMSKQKPETTKQILKRTGGRKLSAYEQGGPATGNEFMRNPSDAEYQDALGNRPGSHFRGTKPGMTVARARYNRTAPDTVPAITIGSGKVWKKGSGGKYTLHNKDGSVYKDKDGLPITVGSREEIARANRNFATSTGKFGNPSAEARKVHAKNYLNKRLARRDGELPPLTSGQRKKISTNTQNYLSGQHSSRMSTSGALTQEHQAHLRHLRSVKKNDPRHFGSQQAKELAHYEARLKQHGRHEIKGGRATGKVVGGGRGKA